MTRNGPALGVQVSKTYNLILPEALNHKIGQGYEATRNEFNQGTSVRCNVGSLPLVLLSGDIAKVPGMMQSTFGKRVNVIRMLAWLTCWINAINDDLLCWWRLVEINPVVMPVTSSSRYYIRAATVTGFSIVALSFTPYSSLFWCFKPAKNCGYRNSQLITNLRELPPCIFQEENNRWRYQQHHRTESII